MSLLFRRVFSGPYFPVLGLNTEMYGVNLRIQSEYRKIRTRKNSVFGHTLVSFYTPWKHQTPRSFVVFSRYQWHEMGWGFVFMDWCASNMHRNSLPGVFCKKLCWQVLESLKKQCRLKPCILLKRNTCASVLF